MDANTAGAELMNAFLKNQLLWVLPLMILSAAAKAELRLDPPQQLLEQAARHREGYFTVLRAIDMNIPELRHRDQIEMYIAILPELERIGRDLSANEISGQAFDLTASTLTNQALRWFRFEADDEKTFKMFFRYAKEGAIATAVNHAASRVAFLNGHEEAKLFAANLAALQKLVQDRQLPLYLRVQIQDLRSTVALKELKNFETLSVADQDFWFQQLSPATGYAAFFYQIHNWSLAANNASQETLAQVRSLMTKILMSLKAQAQAVPQSVLDAFNDTSVAVLTRTLDQSGVIPLEQVKMWTDMLSNRHLVALAWHIRDPQNTPSAEYTPYMLKFAAVVAQSMKEKGMDRAVQDLSRRTQELSGNSKAQENALEGTYRVTFKSGAVFFLNIAFTSTDKLVIGLGDHSYGNFVYFAFFNVEYSVEKDEYIASEREISDELIRNRVIKFKTDGQTISGSLEGTPMKFKTFTGKKIETYIPFLNDPRATPGSPDGDYEGKVACKGFTRKLRLHIDTVLGMQSGIVTLGDQETFVELRHGLKNARKNVVYLTSSAYPNRSFVQVRGIIVKDQFIGQFIVGGVGILCPNIVLNKMRSEK